MSLYGIAVESQCNAVDMGEATFALPCGGSLTNSTTGFLFVAAADVYGDQSQVVDQRLAPGESMTLPGPYPGTVWVISVATAAEVNWSAVGVTAATLGVIGFAGYGLGSMIGHIAHHSRQRRIGYV